MESQDVMYENTDGLEPPRREPSTSHNDKRQPGNGKWGVSMYSQCELYFVPSKMGGAAWTHFGCTMWADWVKVFIAEETYRVPSTMHIYPAGRFLHFRFSFPLTYYIFLHQRCWKLDSIFYQCCVIGDMLSSKLCWAPCPPCVRHEPTYTL